MSAGFLIRAMKYRTQPGRIHLPKVGFWGWFRVGIAITDNDY
jgi:hypothetical protein